MIAVKSSHEQPEDQKLDRLIGWIRWLTLHNICQKMRRFNSIAFEGSTRGCMKSISGIEYVNADYSGYDAS